MKAASFIIRTLSSIVIICLVTSVEAGTPLWTFTPLTATTVAIQSNDTVTVQYLVTNQSSRMHTLNMQSIQGITQVTTGQGVCGNPFILEGKASCTLSLQVNGSQLTGSINDGPIVCEQSSPLQCYRPAAADILRITQADAISNITITVSPSSGSASGGTGVTLTGVGLTGTTGVTFGGVAATSVKVVNSTTVTAVTPAHAAGAVNVVITTTSGSGTNTNAYTYLTTAVGQSAYGGTIARLNDGLNNLIAATADNSAGIEWGGNGTPTFAASTTDGAANTIAIVTVLGTNGGVAYAAQLCSNYEIDSQGKRPCESGNTCYNDWFLPAGNNTTSSGQLNCLYTNRAVLNVASANYWSSTESLTSIAWIQNLGTGLEDSNTSKASSQRVRCVRAFTP
jgi:hypothetical protein